MSETIPQTPDPSPKTPLISEHVKGDSRIMQLSVRSLIALVVTITLCFIVSVIVVRVRDVEQVIPALKEVFIPTVTIVMIFYFTKKSPNNEKPGA